jgi:hypothetical protein
MIILCTIVPYSVHMSDEGLQWLKNVKAKLLLTPFKLITLDGLLQHSSQHQHFYSIF